MNSSGSASGLIIVVPQVFDVELRSGHWAIESGVEKPPN